MENMWKIMGKIQIIMEKIKKNMEKMQQLPGSKKTDPATARVQNNGPGNSPGPKNYCAALAAPLRKTIRTLLGNA